MYNPMLISNMQTNLWYPVASEFGSPVFEGFWNYNIPYLHRHKLVRRRAYIGLVSSWNVVTSLAHVHT